MNTSCFHYCSSVTELDVRHGDASGRSFIEQDCFGYPGFFVFHIKLSIVFSRSVKNCVEILMGIALSLQIVFSRIAIFIVLILKIQEHGHIN